MIFLNAPFLFSWENEHDFLKSAFLIFASNVQCRFLPQFISRLVSGTKFSMLDGVRVTGLSCTKGV